MINIKNFEDAMLHTSKEKQKFEKNEKKVVGFRYINDLNLKCSQPIIKMGELYYTISLFECLVLLNIKDDEIHQLDGELKDYSFINYKLCHKDEPKNKYWYQTENIWFDERNREYRNMLEKYFFNKKY